MSSSALTQERHENLRLKERLKRAAVQAKQATETAMKTATAAGAAFGVAYIEQRYPDKAEIFGVDLSLAAGVGLLAAGAMGVAGDAQTNGLLESAGVGALCAYAAKSGRDKGEEAKNEAA